MSVHSVSKKLLHCSGKKYKKAYELALSERKLRTMHLFAGAGGGILADILLGHVPVIWKTVKKNEN